MRKRKKMISVILGLVMVAGLVACGTDKSETELTETAETDSVAVEADKPKKGTLTVSATYIGTVSPQEQVSVIPLVSGEVAEVNYEVGDYVEAGSVLVRIDDDAVRLQLESAEITKKSAELSAQRTLGSAQDLSNITSKNSIAAIQNQIAAAQRQYETALDGVESSYQARWDLIESLVDINDSIDDLKDDYDQLKDLASAAKKLVVWDNGSSAWVWITDYYERGTESSGGTSATDLNESETEAFDNGEPYNADEYDDYDAAEEQEDESVNYEAADDSRETMAPEVWDAYYKQVSKIASLGYTAKQIGEGQLDAAVTALKTQIDTLESQADTLEKNIDRSDTTIKSAERGAASAGDTIGLYENNLQAAQDAYDIQNGQAYEDTKATLENQIAAANVGVESARMQLENYVITAPISGQIEQKNVDEFGMVSAGNPVYVISNKDSMTITFYVSEAVKLQMSVGQTVTVERNEQNWTATITQIGESVNSRTGLFEIKATVEGSDLTNGVSVKVHADTARTTDALLIPYNAVYFSDEQAYVYCVENDTLVKIQVETGIYNEDTIEIKSGLTQDSVVVNTWSSRLMDGTKVHVEEALE